MAVDTISQCAEEGIMAVPHKRSILSASFFVFDFGILIGDIL